ncbi:hypothetical protein VNO78_02580 [Psophocarpus tetragonolobus]|uniref:Uncharacterized protein n=1 Tax=Psophocarpus tetragonolobus TaxID=3891 RepID=A0AAN9T2N7_PSOTE
MAMASSAEAAVVLSISRWGAHCIGLLPLRLHNSSQRCYVKPLVFVGKVSVVVCLPLIPILGSSEGSLWMTIGVATKGGNKGGVARFFQRFGLWGKHGQRAVTEAEVDGGDIARVAEEADDDCGIAAEAKNLETEGKDEKEAKKVEEAGEG